jgi:predicted DNA-binding transcriptional regulator YafY
MAMVVYLQGRRLSRAEDMAAHFEISVRTTYRDVAALGEAGIPIMAEAGVGYSLVKGYHLPPVMFSAEEAGALFMGGKLVAHLTDASLRKHMESALMKIRSVLPRERQDDLDRLERSTVVLEKQPASIPRLASEALIPIQRALAERRVLALDYLGGARRELTRRHVEPLGLIYYADNWHLIAYCRLRRDMRDFRSDRICSLRLLNEIFTGHTDFSLERYLETAMDADHFETVVIKFKSEVMEPVRRDWSSRLVEEKKEGDDVVVTLQVYALDSFARWVLSFGTKAKVVSPEQLKSLVATEAAKVVAQYSTPAKLDLQPWETLLT